MISKPAFINRLDFELLKKKYPKERELAAVIKQIENNYPVQYAIGDVDFLGSKIFVTEDVLIPRFETELLVDYLSKYILQYHLDKSFFLDMCTGSGCIAISLKKRFYNSRVSALDISEDALKIAKKNAQYNSVDIDFKCIDILKDFELLDKFDVLVSNPPYVKNDEVVTENTKYEPKIALYPGDDDIVFYKRILKISKKILAPKSIIAFEIGATQSLRICEEARKYYPLATIKELKDYNNFDRFIFIFNNCE